MQTPFKSALEKSESFIIENKFKKAESYFRDKRRNYSEIGDFKNFIYNTVLLCKHLIYLGKYEDSFVRINYANKILERELKGSEDYQFLLGEVQHYLGVTNAKMGQYFSAIECLEKSVEEKDKNFRKFPSLADDYYQLGRAYSEVGDYDQAELYLFQAVSIYIILNSYKYKLALALNYLGEVFRINHDQPNNIYWFRKAQGCLNTHEPKLDSDHIFHAICYNSNGLYYWKKGKNEERKGQVKIAQKTFIKAIDSFEKAVLVWKASFPDEKHPEIAIVYNNLGIVNASIPQNYNRAEEYYQLAITINHEIFGTHHPNIGRNYNDKGYLLMLQDDFDNAIDCFQKGIIAVFNGFRDEDWNKNPVIELESIDSFRTLLFSLERKSLALIQLFESNRDENSQYLRYALYSLDVAYSLLKEIFKWCYKRGVSFFFKKSTVKICENLLYTYSTGKEYLKNTSEVDLNIKAFEVAEFSKMVSLINHIRENDMKKVSPSRSKYKKHLSLREAIAVVKEDVKEYLQRGNYSKIKFQEFQEELTHYLEGLHKINNDIYEFDNINHTTGKNEIEIITVQQIADALEDNEGAVVSFFLGYKYCFAIKISQEPVKIFNLTKTISAQEIIKTAVEFKNIFKISSTDLATDYFRKEYVELSFNLYKYLFEEMEKSDLGNINRIYIIPDKELRNIPFGALVRNGVSNDKSNDKLSYKNLNYLIKDYSFSYHYSASILAKDYVSKHQNRVIDNKRKLSLLGIAPEVGGGFDILNIKEVESITEIFKEANIDKVELKVGSSATLEVYKKYSSNSNVIHIASHMRLNKKQPTRSGIELFGKEILTFNNVLYGALNARLVVLSCCSTASDLNPDQDDLITTLSRAFVRSGAENIICTVFDIPGRAAYRLMVDFYKHIINGGTYANALNKAKKNAISIAGNPKSWAGFVFIGDQSVEIKF